MIIDEVRCEKCKKLLVVIKKKDKILWIDPCRCTEGLHSFENPSALKYLRDYKK
jgi:hypothetical protein